MAPPSTGPLFARRIRHGRPRKGSAEFLGHNPGADPWARPARADGCPWALRGGGVDETRRDEMVCGMRAADVDSGVVTGVTAVCRSLVTRAPAQGEERREKRERRPHNREVGGRVDRRCTDRPGQSLLVAVAFLRPVSAWSWARCEGSAMSPAMRKPWAASRWGDLGCYVTSERGRLLPPHSARRSRLVLIVGTRMLTSASS